MGPVLGPVLGGLIVSNYSWRWIFYIKMQLQRIYQGGRSRMGHFVPLRCHYPPSGWASFAL
jgi:MFS family permease